jgi:hypothetical protein
MDAHNHSAVAKWLAVIAATACFLAWLPAANAETAPVSPIPTDWIPATDPCGGMIPAMGPMQCHGGAYYASFLPLIEG